MKNRKQTDTYRFNGHPTFRAASIRTVGIAELKLMIKQLEAKLLDPHDVDDKKWTTRWLNRYRKELDKKQAGLVFKQRERQKRRRSPRVESEL